MLGTVFNYHSMKFQDVVNLNKDFNQLGHGLSCCSGLLDGVKILSKYNGFHYMHYYVLTSVSKNDDTYYWFATVYSSKCVIVFLNQTF